MPLILGQNRPAFIFDGPHRTVAVDGHHQSVSKFPCTLQVSEMANVQNVETAVGEHKPSFPSAARQIFQPPEFHEISSFTAWSSSS